MAHGASDWFGTTPQGMVHRVADLAELAVRMGSHDLFDRRGNVLFMDSFANGLAGWEVALSGGVAAIYPVATPVRTGALAITIATDAVAGAASNIHRWFGMPFISRMGLEIAFSLPLDARDFRLFFTVQTATRTWTYIARWRQSAGELALFNSAGAYQLVASPGAVYVTEATWYNLKLVVDPVAGLYTRLMFNAQEYDVSAIVPWSVGAVFAPVCGVGIDASSDIAGSVLYVLDDVILTMNE